MDGDYRPPSQKVSASRRMWDKESLLEDAEVKFNREAYDMLVEILTLTG